MRMFSGWLGLMSKPKCAKPKSEWMFNCSFEAKQLNVTHIIIICI